MMSHSTTQTKESKQSQTKRKGAVAENATAGDLLKTKVGEGIAEKDQGRSRQRMGDLEATLRRREQG